MVYEDFVLVKLILFYSLSGNLLSGYYCTTFMILFGCLVTLNRIRGMAVVKVLFDTGNNRLVVRRKQSHMHLLKIPVFIEYMMLIRHDCLPTKAFYSFYFLTGIGNTP